MKLTRWALEAVEHNPFEHFDRMLEQLGPEWKDATVVGPKGDVLYNPIENWNGKGTKLAVKMNEDGSLSHGFIAYHGSAKDFDKFDLNKIGTGEGYQFRGRGLYFAEEQKVAQKYKDMLAGQAGTEGKLYQVMVKHHPGDFLDWDTLVSNQSDKIKEALKKLGAPVNGTGADAYLGLAKELVKDKGLSDFDMSSPDMREAHALIAERLRDAGVPGSRFFDRRSREKGEGTKNYVVNTDSNIDVIRKWGLAGLGIGGAATAGLISGSEAKAQTGGNETNLGEAPPAVIGPFGRIDPTKYKADSTGRFLTPITGTSVADSATVPHHELGMNTWRGSPAPGPLGGIVGPVKEMISKYGLKNTLKAAGLAGLEAAKGQAQNLLGAVTAPGDVYAGKLDPFSEEGLERATALAGMMGGPGPKGSLGAGVKWGGKAHDYLLDEGEKALGAVPFNSDLFNKIHSVIEAGPEKIAKSVENWKKHQPDTASSFVPIIDKALDLHEGYPPNPIKPKWSPEALSHLSEQAVKAVQEKKLTLNQKINTVIEAGPEAAAEQSFHETGHFGGILDKALDLHHEAVSVEPTWISLEQEMKALLGEDHPVLKAWNKEAWLKEGEKLAAAGLENWSKAASDELKMKMSGEMPAVGGEDAYKELHAAFYNGPAVAKQIASTTNDPFVLEALNKALHYHEFFKDSSSKPEVSVAKSADSLIKQAHEIPLEIAGAPVEPYVVNPNNLSMAPEAVAARKQEMGFDPNQPLLHIGVNYPLEGREPYSFKDPTFTHSGAIWASDQRGVARLYAGGEQGQVFDLYHNAKNPTVVDWEGKSAIGTNMSGIIKYLRSLGHDLVIFKNVEDTGSHEPQTQYAFLKNNLLRQSGAVFDPAFAESANTMRAGAPIGGLGQGSGDDEELSPLVIKKYYNSKAKPQNGLVP